MARNPRFDVLFEPVRIGPVTAPNRFYAVPHASGMTNAMPRMRAGFRGMKAEGGWGVVCTGYYPSILPQTTRRYLMPPSGTITTCVRTRS